MSWLEVKEQQAKNIAKLHKEYPDAWFYKAEMAKPEHERVGFAPKDGVCWCCKRNICEGEYGITVEKLGDGIITGCPHCNRSYCD